MVNDRWSGSSHDLSNLHGCWGCERWSSEGVAEAETCAKHGYWSSKSRSTISDGGGGVMDNCWCWRGDSYARGSEYRRGRGCKCRCSMVNDRWSGSSHDLSNLHGCWGCERWSSEGVAEAETCAKHGYWSSKSRSTISDGGGRRDGQLLVLAR
ncbi:hypothetical protein MRX96_026508 [Rhipicephalus microplus]